MKLTAENISFAYKGGTPVLRNLSFELAAGRATLVAGVNGAGKSTLIGLLAGLFSPDSGELIFGDARGAAAMKNLRRRTALVPQNIEHWILGDTAREDIWLGLDERDPTLRARFDALCDRWGLTPILDQPVETLSLGQKKRLAFTAAVLKDCDALLLDEPLAGLNWPGQVAMLHDLAELKAEGKILCLVSHDAAVLAPLIDHCLLLTPNGGFFCGTFTDSAPFFEEFGIRPISL